MMRFWIAYKAAYEKVKPAVYLWFSVIYFLIFAIVSWVWIFRLIKQSAGFEDYVWWFLASGGAFILNWILITFVKPIIKQ